MPHGVKGSTPTCKAPGCTRKAFSRGLCTLHYQRVRRHGDYFFKKTHDVSPEGRKRMSDGLKRYHKSQRAAANRSRAIKIASQYRSRQKSLEHMKKMTKLAYKKKNKIVNDRDFYTSFIKRHCPELYSNDEIPVSVYKELIDFFHPELLPTMEREWKIYLDD